MQDLHGSADATEETCAIGSCTPHGCPPATGATSKSILVRNRSPLKEIGIDDLSVSGRLRVNDADCV